MCGANDDDSDDDDLPNVIEARNELIKTRPEEVEQGDESEGAGAGFCGSIEKKEKEET